MNKVNYGFDAPAIMRNLIIFGLLTMALGWGVQRSQVGAQTQLRSPLTLWMKFN